MLNSPKRSMRPNNKRLARLDIKNDANTDTPSVSADFKAIIKLFYYYKMKLI